MPSLGSKNDSKQYNKQSYGRDGVSDSNNIKSMKSTETSSSRGIVYPEDVELQAVDSDEDRAMGHSRTRSDEVTQAKSPYIPDKLCLKPAVLTEIAVGSPGPQSTWTRHSERGIEVKRDFVITKERN